MAKTDKNGHTNAEGARVEKQLTPEQWRAVDCLAQGLNDGETAEQIGCARSSVNAWKLYHPGFQSALNQRRASLWEASSDRVRTLIPKALDVLEATLENDVFRDHQLKAACMILKTVALPVATFDRRDEAAIIADAAKEEERRNFEEWTCNIRPAEVRAKLLAKANGEEWKEE